MRQGFLLAFRVRTANFRRSHQIICRTAMPNPAPLISSLCQSEAATAAAATQLASIIRPGDLLVLEGALAAGKTQFIKYLCSELQIRDTVTSPTFTLAHFYAGPIIPVLHIDAYRIETEHEFLDLTLHDYFDDHLTAIEWGAKFQDVLPPALHIQIDPIYGYDNARRLTLASNAPSWTARVDALRAATESCTPCD